MIPAFPAFKILELSDKEEIASFTSGESPYSDFNFNSLWSWDVSNERMVSKLNGNLVIQFTDYVSEALFYSFIGTHEPEDTSLSLIAHAEENGISPVLRLVPEGAIGAVNSPLLHIREDRDNFDYVYDVQELLSLKGAKHKDTRHLVSKFERAYAGARFEVGELNNSDVQNSIISVLRRWEREKERKAKDYGLAHEELAIRRLMQSADPGTLLVGGVFIGDAMIGFSVDEVLPGGYSISHFYKADSSHVGVYEFLNNKMAAHLDCLGITLWNWEQDLGLSNLRHSKMAYRPVRFLKKFCVSATAQ